MEFKIRKDEFLRGLYLAHGIADRKSTLPILANVLLRTDGKDKLLCGATDLNVTTLVTLSAKIEKEGGLTVGARQLYEIVKGLPGDEVHVRRTEQNWAEIRAGKVEFKVVGLSDRDYPKLPAISEAQTFKVETAALRRKISPPAGSRPMRHPFVPGGASPATISPLTAIKARVTPRPRSVFKASSAAYPFAIAPRSSCIPASLNSTVRCLLSSTKFRHPTD